MLDLFGVVSIVPESLGCLMFNLNTLLVADYSKPVYLGGQKRIFIGWMVVWTYIQTKICKSQFSVYFLIQWAIFASVNVEIQQKEVAICLSLKGELYTVASTGKQSKFLGLSALCSNINELHPQEHQLEGWILLSNSWKSPIHSLKEKRQLAFSKNRTLSPSCEAS